MNIRKFMSLPGARITIGNTWLCYDASEKRQWTVCQRKARQKYTRVLLETNELGLALETMVGMNAIGAQGAE